MNITVKRSEWLKGVGNQNSFLCHPLTNEKCIIGFWALGCGYSEKEIKGIKGIVTLKEQDEERAKIFGNIDFIHEAFEWNDLTHIPDELRESKLEQIFEQAGHTLSIVD